VLDVCTAIEDMKKDAQKAILLSDIKKIMKNLGLPIEQAMDVLEISENDRKQLSEMLS
jgi:hypothetical protein